MKFIKTILIICNLSSTTTIFAQNEDLHNIMNIETPKKEFVNYAYKSSRVVMSHSFELIKPGTMDFRILHRFGNINQGVYQLFGLDQATMRMGFDFGITKNFMLGIGRSTHKKEFDGFIKYRLIQQTKGPGSFPLSLVIVTGSTVQTLKWSDPNIKHELSSRFAYYGQLIIGRKFTDILTLQASPSILYRNYILSTDSSHQLYSLGLGGRIRLSKRISLNFDYFYRINPNKLDESHNPFSVGFDIETGGHVFQLHFTNAIGMNERTFLTETTNDWAKGDVQFGFNLSRIFQLRKKKQFS